MCVVHCKREKYDVYIGRPSRWGNPFQIGPDGNREQVVEKYRIWLYKQVQQGKISLEDLAGLEGKILGCWCSPEACHGDILVRASKWAKGKLDIGA